MDLETTPPSEWILGPHPPPERPSNWLAQTGGWSAESTQPETSLISTQSDETPLMGTQA